MRHFKRLRAGVDAVSAQEYNALCDAVEQLTQALPGHTIVSGGQIATRSVNRSSSGTRTLIAEIINMSSSTGVATLSPVRLSSVSGTFLHGPGYGDASTYITANLWGTPREIPIGTVVQVWEAIDGDGKTVTMYTEPMPPWLWPTSAADGQVFQARNIGGVMQGVYDWVQMR